MPHHAPARFTTRQRYSRKPTMTKGFSACSFFLLIQGLYRTKTGLRVAGCRRLLRAPCWEYPGGIFAVGDIPGPPFPGIILGKKGRHPREGPIPSVLQPTGKDPGVLFAGNAPPGRFRHVRRPPPTPTYTMQPSHSMPRIGAVSRVRVGGSRLPQPTTNGRIPLECCAVGCWGRCPNGLGFRQTGLFSAPNRAGPWAVQYVRVGASAAPIVGHYLHRLPGGTLGVMWAAIPQWGTRGDGGCRPLGILPIWQLNRQNVTRLRGRNASVLLKMHSADRAGIDS